MPIVVDGKTKLTYADYALIPEDRNRHEIIDGEHYVSPAPLVYHQQILGRLYVQLAAAVQTPGLGQVLLAPTDVELSATDIVQPDILVVLSDHESIVTRERLIGAPDLVVEILSASTARRDRGIKQALYERAGVREYWVVDSDRAVVDQLVLSAGAYASREPQRTELTIACLASGTEHRSETPTSATIDLRQVW